MGWLWRGIAAAVTLAVAAVLDPYAYVALRAVLGYEHWGEMRELLTAAKFICSGLGTAVVAGVVWGLDPLGRRRVGVLVLAVVVAATAGAALKVLTGRERPSHESQPPGQERRGLNGPVAGASSPYFQSFPSGHTVSAFASATALSSFYPPARVVLFGVAVTAGVNRVVKHQHFLSDVVAGAWLGHLLALAVLMRPSIRRRWQPPPKGREIASLDGGRPLAYSDASPGVQASGRPLAGRLGGTARRWRPAQPWDDDSRGRR